MRVLVACECSGVVRDAFLRQGHDAVSCDLLPSEVDGPHLIADALAAAYAFKWDLMIAHPPCTYLSRAGARWWNQPGREEKAVDAANFAMSLYECPIPMVCIENPIGQLNSRWRYPDQMIEPWWFGHPYSKATCLWLKNLPILVATHICAEYTPLLPSNVGHGRRKGQSSHRGHVHNAKDASRTFTGVGEAMADQWGALALGKWMDERGNVYGEMTPPPNANLCPTCGWECTCR